MKPTNHHTWDSKLYSPKKLKINFLLKTSPTIIPWQCIVSPPPLQNKIYQILFSLMQNCKILMLTLFCQLFSLLLGMSPLEPLPTPPDNVQAFLFPPAQCLHSFSKMGKKILQISWKKTAVPWNKGKSLFYPADDCFFEASWYCTKQNKTRPKFSSKFVPELTVTKVLLLFPKLILTH